MVDVYSAYKVLAKTADGGLVSAFDGSDYKIGIWRSEAARPGHGGGFYCYLDANDAIAATRRGTTFHASVSDGKSLVLCSVKVAGNCVEYDDDKLAMSRLRVLKELQAVEIG